MKNLSNEWVPYDEEAGIQFQIRGLSVFDLAEIRSDLVKKEVFNPETGEYEQGAFFGSKSLRTLLKNGLVAWEGITNGDGEYILYSWDDIECLTAVQVEYIGFSIFNKSTMDDEARKKSLSSQTSPGTPKSTIAKPAKRGTATKKQKQGTKSTK